MSPTPRPTDPDTIAARATAPGVGAIGIVRVSGPAAGEVARRLLGTLPPPRRARFTPFVGAAGEVLDEGLALWFPGPASYTGEDLLELHGHGGPVVLERLLRRVLELGARPARPGEFTERAFLNGRLSLEQAEAVADLISAGSEQAARAAMNSLRGALGRRCRALAAGLMALRARVEATLDFAETEPVAEEWPEVRGEIDVLCGELDELRARAGEGLRLARGLQVVIAGRPNTGKSSLLNALAGEPVAIVTDIPGTTRDLVHAEVLLEGLHLRLADTAGLRPTGDPVEQEGQRRTREALRGADLVLLMVDAREGPDESDRALLAELPPACAVRVLYNKIDLSGERPGRVDGPLPGLRLSLATGEGMDLLREMLREAGGSLNLGEDGFLARRRHLQALERVHGHLLGARGQQEAELLAEELRLAHCALGEITGECGSEELLGAIFSEFCIGK
ncbi:MAG: tRNA uridine-5-carboxymethylaminomethyl(34) synthesis GTPase MnmE [Gammaproteobacteria bacterium]|nr:MAG: tRNA uridine-5-carboxymethylaminomethyl(34) synthesis GTPase MnmE [Gammaproteobacteria bacterium]